MQLPSTAHIDDKVISFTLENANGASAKILNYGAIVSELNIPSRQHGIINTVLAYDNSQDYLTDPFFHGAVAGRYCNRIANSRFTLGNTDYRLAANEAGHHLHGGSSGFSRRLWQLKQYSRQSLSLSLFSPDGDQGYPGNLYITLSYQLRDDNSLLMVWQALSDRDTVASLTNHAYFNLSASKSVADHYLKIHARHYTPCDNELIPLGDIVAVDGSDFDLRKFIRIGQLLNRGCDAFKSQKGIDHNWARGDSGAMKISAELMSPHSQLLLQVYSTLPGLQCYTGNHLGSNGVHHRHQGVCLETQHYPNSPNQHNFPSARLNAGRVITHQTLFKFQAVDYREILKNDRTLK